MAIKKRVPGDYPTMAFRVSPKDKEGLSKLLNHIHQLANKGEWDDGKRIKKNDLIVEALYKGLGELKKKYR